MKIRSELSIFYDNLGNSYFLEKEDKRGSTTKKKVEKRSCLKKRTTSLVLEMFWSPYIRILCIFLIAN
jgi:hypothetical protein